MEEEHTKGSEEAASQARGRLTLETAKQAPEIPSLAPPENIPTELLPKLGRLVYSMIFSYDSPLLLRFIEEKRGLREAAQVAGLRPEEEKANLLVKSAAETFNIDPSWFHEWMNKVSLAVAEDTIQAINSRLEVIRESVVAERTPEETVKEAVLQAQAELLEASKAVAEAGLSAPVYYHQECVDRASALGRVINLPFATSRRRHSPLSRLLIDKRFA